jgi:hypothetical protein
MTMHAPMLFKVCGCVCLFPRHCHMMRRSIAPWASLGRLGSPETTMRQGPHAVDAGRLRDRRYVLSTSLDNCTRRDARVVPRRPPARWLASELASGVGVTGATGGASTSPRASLRSSLCGTALPSNRGNPCWHWEGTSLRRSPQHVIRRTRHLHR